jgi:hypothetical protein
MAAGRGEVDWLVLGTDEVVGGRAGDMEAVGEVLAVEVANGRWVVRRS